MSDVLNAILGPIEHVVAWILTAFYTVLSPVFGKTSGATWGLSIVGLVVVMRVLLIPLFVKQIRAQRGLQLLQPEIKKIQAQYKDDRERQSQELMKLYRETGTNPLASCMPLLLQAPIFFALFRVLNGIGGSGGVSKAQNALDATLAGYAADAHIFGARIPETFMNAQGAAAKVVSLVMIVLMSASTFFTQKQLMSKNMPASAMEGSFAQQQKIMLYLFPVIFAVTGVNFPIGVLLYWLTTNVWSMGQQFYVIQRMPAPGSIAAENLERKRAEKARRSGTVPAAPVDATTGPATPAAPARPAGQRQQPKRMPKGKRRPPQASRPADGIGDGSTPAP
ncbi:MAG: membrane protein insertase YidC [Actinomycetota bacterium]|nr:membrane protein insertase YidC [Actinomycetota bacterium]